MTRFSTPRCNPSHEKIYTPQLMRTTALKQYKTMQSRAELYELLGYFDYEALDSSIVKTIVP
jgi:methylisocitrate lyase